MSRDDYIPHVYRGRILCDVLEEMRTSVKTLNFAPMLSLIEEVQTMGNRMETALEEKKNYYELAKILRKKLLEIKDGKTDRKNIG